jgi:hypothetical protein
VIQATLDDRAWPYYEHRAALLASVAEGQDDSFELVGARCLLRFTLTQQSVKAVAEDFIAEIGKVEIYNPHAS